MTVLQIPAHRADSLTAGPDDSTVNVDEVRMRAHWRHPATVVTISGDVDLANSDGVQDFATRFVLIGNAMVLDLSGVEFFSARGISVLIAVNEACRTADMPWSLIPSRIVNRVLQLTGFDTNLLTASSVPEALQQVASLTQARHRLALAITTTHRHAG